MKIKKNDMVQIIAGKDKGKTGKVLSTFPKLERVLVEGVNIKKKCQKPKKSGQKGQIIEKTFPIDVSNAMLIDPKTKKPTRIGKKSVKGKFVRVSKKSGTILD